MLVLKPKWNKNQIYTTRSNSLIYLQSLLNLCFTAFSSKLKKRKEKRRWIRTGTAIMLAAWRRLYRLWRRHSRSYSRFQKQTRKDPKKRWGWTLSATPALSSLFFSVASASLSSSPSWNTSPRLLPFYNHSLFLFPLTKKSLCWFQLFINQLNRNIINF